MYRFIRPLLFTLDAETAHGLSFSAAGMADRLLPWVVRGLFGYENPGLEQEIWGHTFKNPIGLAAGADKNAQTVRFWQHLGLGYVEIGSVTAKGGEGNPKPRSFRLVQDGALINRMGLNNHGARVISARLRDGRSKWSFPIGVNVAKTHDPSLLEDDAVADFVSGFKQMAPWADYIALNISCPNTAEGKTFEHPDALDQLLGAIMKVRSELNSRTPVLVKWSPPLPGENIEATFDQMIARCVRHKVDGHIATNTAPDRVGLITDKTRLAQIGKGGMSGLPLAARARELLSYLYRRTGKMVPIIAVGGIDSAEEAYRRIRLGASLIQIYTGLIYEGPGLVKRINKGLVEMLKRDGYSSITEAVGVDVNN